MNFGWQHKEHIWKHTLYIVFDYERGIGVSAMINIVFRIGRTQPVSNICPEREGRQKILEIEKIFTSYFKK